ncbi:hypothetical protein [Psychroserpens sp. Hel_I_66]|uniref:hypothetical protein n=1 Tax=Psychroserpens sp. Hel_I_66 TaxID=1250004 RepID=UPI000647E240|nr:hypothetical protein [Psychroserpens sp. Hel_I_66]
MTENEIKKNWKNLITPFIVYIALFIIALGLNRFGSKKPTPQTVSLFASVFCLTFIFFYGVKIINFKKFLNESNNN